MGFEILTAVTINTAIFWDMSLYSGESSQMFVRNAHLPYVCCSILDYLLTPWLLVRKRTIPTERPPLVGEVSANFCG
jgi:hypothetical protein